MLIITRNLGQSVTIGNARVFVLKGPGGRIKLGIEAPREIPIRRDDADGNQPARPAPVPQLPPPADLVAA
ncbi:carbon storage regulator [Bremerella cremea]|uniref:carbon storage regulator n=1 Tax=Bremerella cremea TaxID=1031537 RepID=UPI0031EC8E4F